MSIYYAPYQPLMPGTCLLAIAGVEAFAAVGATVLGLGLGLWATDFLRSGLKRRTRANVAAPLITVVSFAVTGAIPTAVAALVSTREAATASGSGYFLGLGVGWIVGWLFRSGTGSITTSTRTQRIDRRQASTTDGQLRALALGVTAGPRAAEKLSGLSDAEFEAAFNAGAMKSLRVLESATAEERRIFMGLLAGEPLASIANELKLDSLKVAETFVEMLRRAN